MDDEFMNDFLCLPRSNRSSSNLYEVEETDTDDDDTEEEMSGN